MDGISADFISTLKKEDDLYILGYNYDFRIKNNINLYFINLIGVDYPTYFEVI